MMRFLKPALAALATVCALLNPGRPANASDYVYLMPDIGDYLWLVEAYMPTSFFGKYFETGALVEGDFFAGFADLDGDGSDELLVAVDHPTACGGNVCDLFTFALDPEGPDLYAPCNWLLADRSRTPIRRSLYERFVTVSGKTAVMTDLSIPFNNERTGVFDGVFDGKPWRDYFAAVYGTPIEWDDIRLSDIRVAAHDLNGDGRDEEVFIYVVKPSMCGRDECGGAILELLPHEDGSEPGWRWIGELANLYVADDYIIGENISSSPARRVKVTNTVIDGYPSLCTRLSHLSWNGETYDIFFRYGCALP
jgi:hypothetical protein